MWNLGLVELSGIIFSTMPIDKMIKQAHSLVWHRLMRWLYAYFWDYHIPKYPSNEENPPSRKHLVP